MSRKFYSLAECLLTGSKNLRIMEAENRGSIAFSSTYRPLEPLDIYSCQLQHLSKLKPYEVRMTDGESHNYNGQEIPPAALRALLKRPSLASAGTEADLDSGRLTGMIFISERDNLETLHIAFHLKDDLPKIFSLADVFGTSTFHGVRMEDSGCMAVDNLIYVSTKEQATKRRQPWTAVYKTNLQTGKTDRLTPAGKADLCPAVSPSGKHILVASFQRKGWQGAIEDLKTDIFVMNVDRPFNRRMILTDGGWPTWGSEDVLFFHRNPTDNNLDRKNCWGVYRVNIIRNSSGDIVSTGEPERMTPENIDAVTPAAINATTVAVATIRQKSWFRGVRVEAQYRHIEIFSTTRGPQNNIQITQKARPKADHFNPFVIDGGKRIGYHRCKYDLGTDRLFQKFESPHPELGLFRVSGLFPAFSKDGSKFAFVDNEYEGVWIADKEGVHLAYKDDDGLNVYSPVWNQVWDTLYVCVGARYNVGRVVNIYAISHASSDKRRIKKLTQTFNNESPSSSPDGRRLVFRSDGRSEGRSEYKNLYIMEDVELGEIGGCEITTLTEGEWLDTDCQWSPSSDWIVFTSTRDKPKHGVPKFDHGLDPGYFGLYLVDANDPSVVVRVMGSGNDFSGHVSNPFFSPGGNSIVLTSDLAAVSVDPISFVSVRSSTDIFIVDIDPNDINKNRDVKKFSRITHSRYENGTATWAAFSTRDPNIVWKKVTTMEKDHNKLLLLPKRCC
ncbi:hypothetical protein ACHQM5_016359 [Ranunculus cassubicifolius]